MSWRAVFVHAWLLVVLVVGLVVGDDEGPEATPTGDPGASIMAAQSVVLLPVAEADVTEVAWTDADRTFVVRAKTDTRGRWFELEGSERPRRKSPKKATADPHASHNHGPADGPGDAPIPPKVLVPVPAVETPKPAAIGADGRKSVLLRAGHAAEALWSTLGPLRALRDMGPIDAAKRAELGLDHPSATLTITAAGVAHRFDIGGEVFGSRDRYALTEAGHAVVLPVMLTRDLSAGTGRFAERRLFTARRHEMVGLTAKSGALSLAIEQRERADVHRAHWVRAGGTEPVAAAKSWIDKLLTMEAQGWHRAAIATGGVEIASIAIQGAHGTESMSLIQKDDGRIKRWFVRSDHGRLIAEVRRTTAEELVADLLALRP